VRLFARGRSARNASFRGGRNYGVATYCKSRSARTTLPPWDREGRIVISEFSRRKLAVINLYAVRAHRSRADHG
jgi:hypothetical protein